MDRGRIEDVRRRFLERCRADAELLRRQAGGTLDETARTAIHRMAGLAGTLGYASLSRSAAALDDLVAEGAGAPSQLLTELADMLDRTADGAS